jgi:hypothetical protein
MIELKTQEVEEMLQMLQEAPNKFVGQTVSFLQYKLDEERKTVESKPQSESKPQYTDKK